MATGMNPSQRPDAPRLLAEDVVLLCWDDDGGQVHKRCVTGLKPGIGGALIIDALLAGTIHVDEERVHPTGTPAHDPAVGEVAAETGPDRREQPPSAVALVQAVGTTDRLWSMRDRLVDAGILGRQQRRRFGLLTDTRFPTADPARAAEPREAVRPLLTGETDPGEVDTRTALLAGLAGATNAVDRLVERPRRTGARRRAQRLAEGDAVTGMVDVVNEAIVVAMSAAAAAAVVPAVAPGPGGDGGG